jgi:undecaprenyl diphosphate synthase
MKFYRIPTHIAIIMDGNGRWAEQRGLPRIEGHRAGAESIRLVITTLAEYGVKFLTFYVFSTENWFRPPSEVRDLVHLLSEEVERETEALHQKGVKICHLGGLSNLPKKLQRQIQQALELTRNNTTMTLSIAFDYGGRAEIVQAVRAIVRQGIPADKIDETLFGHYLRTANLPDPDLIIRTGGEKRLSNFLPWQSAYSELYFTPVLWPDFDREEIEKALGDYSRRERRFGRVPKAKKPSQ